VICKDCGQTFTYEKEHICYEDKRNIDELKAQNKKLIDALKFYAKEKHMGTAKKRFMRSDCYAVDDGYTAREALKDIDK
jgi:hypothetical protein